MDKGTALFNGERIFFTSTVLNPWTRQLDYQIAWNGKAIWVRADQLSDIRYVIGA